MKRLMISLPASFALALAACGGEGDDALAEDVEERYEERADQLEEMADAAEERADQLEERAEQVDDMGEAMGDAIDEADVVVEQ
ncbi:hypothetical protein [Sphingomicrobium lutaoense]|uniref:Methyl-accepting chemotaxis protein n=1 Tax=Sphingomicrobium lutaoense TaxID=515949 RepID=A0A839Z2Z8_9SPHN|nr:hypothetical protein [Sphingomicrobium lutaoense]MBB3764133.1 methyl-accepting chemotaxis protein [Sphingomicrobium lutaoense]